MIYKFQVVNQLKKKKRNNSDIESNISNKKIKKLINIVNKV